MDNEQLKFPIGKWVMKKKYSEKEIQKNIITIAKYPAKYKRLTKNLSEADLARTYRDGSWNVRQLLVHIADMHILHYGRFKQALSDENPTGFYGNINAWNALQEVNTASIVDALLLLEATHKRWVHLMQTMQINEFERTFYHPIRQITLSLAQALAMGAWHSKHHFEHIKIALGKS